MSRRTDALAGAAWDALQRLIRELAARKPGAHLLEARLRRQALRLELELPPGPDARRVFSSDLVQALEGILDRWVEQEGAFAPGRVYCYRCRSPECEHSHPPSPRHVMESFAPTGAPVWKDFAQLCLERRHPEVDRLYDTRPALITLVHTQGEVRGGLLEAFEDGQNRVLGQLTAGFFPVPTSLNEGRGVLALTFQVTARGRGRRAPLALNLLGVGPGGEALTWLWERYREVPWRRAWRWGQAELARLGRTRRRGRGVGAREVEALLQGMARRLTRDARARGRRTHHAQQRHETGHRPTRMAVKDLAQADSGRLFVDERTGSRVVLGERGRTHFFSPEGQLVSSVRYSREAIERKRRRGLWRAATEEEAAVLKGCWTPERQSL